MSTLETARLRLEPLRDEHLDGLHALNSDPEVMRYISGEPETREQTLAVIARVKARWLEVGYSWWAFVERDSGEIVGAGCLQNLRREATPLPDPACPLEIGWRLRRDAQGRGYASEAAVAICDFAFDARHADELLAVCHPDNVASAKVMQRIGMQPQGLQHWYGKEVTTYRIDAATWHANAATRSARPAR
ncbi:GNAT family N-acetyltransferase [Scleromatobacter humisilvae]|uniref:GNAT family N-acetyltransferase n=1 Tax=Scleromatobacter humisilvae TaxID=2897159 RepID=A0A9X1YI17_9BURK|nr:GNAT family N-acetyltransferase [Scleromatobacter humisilvae]MCK9686291.1 GNAT family N-acetyltransferase [Scleromatobacter humisilvae]